MTAAVQALAADAKRAGPSHWWRSYKKMLLWEFTGMRLLLPITVAVQIISGAGFVLGIGLLFEEIPARSALYLSTGATVVTLIMVGLVMGPQLVAQQRMEGSYDFLWSLPVPRSAAAGAWVTLNLVIAIPGMIVALAAAVWRYDISFSVHPMVVPAVLVTLVVAALLGYALAHGIPRPEVTLLVTQLLIFAILGFAPINFPPENMPAWLSAVNEYLPFLSMATVVRAGLTDGLVSGVGTAYAVLAVWLAIGAGISAWALRRRK